MITCGKCGQPLSTKTEICPCTKSFEPNNAYDASYEVLLMHEKLDKIESDLKSTNIKIDQVVSTLLAQSKAILTTMDSVSALCVAIELLNQVQIQQNKK